MMKVSFLVTYYNQKQYVSQSLESILKLEKPFQWEILVGDDGSDDGTTQVVREYMDRYPENIFLYVMDREPEKKYEVVRRASANRLNLVGHMTGDFFCVLDGDDYYCHPGFVARALEIFEKDPTLSIVAFGYQAFSETAGILSRHTLPAGAVDPGHYLQTGLYTPGGACVLRNYMSPQRKAYLEGIGYFDDNNIVINNLHFGGMYAIDEISYAYRQTQSSIYNSMAYAEKAVLNAQSYDVDALLLPQHRDALALRYGTCLLQTHFLGSKLGSMLGSRKWEQYYTSCRQLEASVTATMLDPSNATGQEKQQLSRLIRHIFKAHPKSSCMTFLRCWKRRILG